MYGTLPALNRNHDYCTEYGAAILAARIRAYWAARGHAPAVWVQDSVHSVSPSRPELLSYTVRSDMKGGMPAC
jgi:hypothetical protein